MEARLRNASAIALPSKWRPADGPWFEGGAAAAAAAAAEAAAAASKGAASGSAAAVGKKRKRDAAAGAAAPAEAPKAGAGVAAAAVPHTPAPPALVAQFRELAARLLAEEVSRNEKERAESTSADTRWLRTVLTSGTASDKLAALTLLVQESPLHALRHLDSLLSLAGKRSRREALKAVDAVKDLFVSSLLPSDRRLQAFATRPFESLPAAPTKAAEQLVLWLFEEELKTRYGAFIATLQEHMSDALVHFKTHALKTVYDLLCEKPEQEAALLTVLVNKLGDPVGKVASKAQFLLQQLVERHEAMKPVVVRETRQFLIRPHLSSQAQYYAAVFLNQIHLRRGQPGLALDLIATYFSLFELCVQRRQLDSRLLGALLTGINRAFPFAADDAGSPEAAAASQASIESRADTLFSVVHRSNPNTSVQALALLQQVALRRVQGAGASSDGPAAAPGAEGLRGLGVEGEAAASTGAAATPAATAAAAGGEGEGTFVDRFYRALYSKLTLSDVGATSKDSILLNLLFRAIKHDPDATRARAVIKRLVQVALHQPAAFAAGVVLLVAELARTRAAIKDMLTVPEAAAAAGASAAAAAAAGGASNGAAAPVDKAAAGADSESEDEDGEGAAEEEGDGKAAAGGDGFVLPTPEEKARALRLLQSMAVEGGEEEDDKAAAAGKGADRTVSFDGPSAAAAAATAAAGTAAAPRIRYDPLKRDPRYAGAEASCLWELAPLALHFHPSVRKFADDVLAAPGAPVAYGGDPLSDFTLMAFLDRYMYKNPKQRPGKGKGEGGEDGDRAGAQAAAAAALLAAGDDAALSKEQIAAGYAMVQQGVDPAALLAKGGAAGAGAGATSAMQKRAPKHGRADTEAPANTAEFAARDPGAVAEEDRFMHTFFRTQASMDALRPSAAKRRRTEAASDDEEGGSGAAGGAHAAGEGDEAADSDAEEAEMDAFADKLADDLLRTAAGGADPDPDDDEWLDEEGAPTGDPFGSGGGGEGDEEDDGGDDFGEEGADGDSEGDEGSGDEEEDEDEDEEEEEVSEEEGDVPVAIGKGRKALASGGAGVFADADDFAEALAEEEGRYEAAFASRFGGAEGNASASGSGSGGGKKPAGAGAPAAASKFGGGAAGAGGGKSRPGRGGGGAGRGRGGGFGGAGRGRGGSRGGSSRGGGSRGFRGGGRR